MSDNSHLEIRGGYAAGVVAVAVALYHSTRVELITRGFVQCPSRMIGVRKCCSRYKLELYELHTIAYIFTAVSIQNYQHFQWRMRTRSREKVARFQKDAARQSVEPLGLCGVLVRVKMFEMLWYYDTSRQFAYMIVRTYNQRNDCASECSWISCK